MVGEYVTLTEAAELESTGYDTMQKKVRRAPEKYHIIMKQNETGGKELVMVAVSSLSKKARTAWKERQKLKAVAESPAIQKEEPEALEVPWYINEDVDYFIENHKKEWYKAMELGNIVREFLDYDERGRTGYAESFAQERLGKGKRTLYRYAKSYMEAMAWADKMHKKDGVNYDFYKVLCLCRKPKEAGTFPSFTPEVRQAIKNIWFNEEFAQNQGTKEMLYAKLEVLKDTYQWKKIPSYPSVARYINYLMEDGHMRNAWYLASRGEREYKNKVMVKGERSTKDLKVMEILMGDEHTFDCWVVYTHPNGKVTAIKPRLVAWIDIKSRMVLGSVMCKDANSDTLKESLLQLIYRDAGSVPKYIYIDNGKDYVSKEMTGSDKFDFDDTTKGFYRSVGIEDFHRALPYYPWTKGNIERFFRTVCDQFSKWFSSYTGTLTGSKTLAKIDKDINGMLGRGELFTLEEFFEKWTDWLNNVYAVKQHSSLKRQGEEFTTPIGCFKNAEKYIKPAPPKSQATVLMLKSERSYVYNTGIKFAGLTYRSDDLCMLIGTHADIKYDPHDMGTIYVFQKGKQVCEAYAQELLGFASGNGVEQKALKDHFRMQKKQLKRDKEIIKEANVPFTGINGQYAGHNGTVGSTWRKRPEEKKTGNVISLPEDNTYRNGFRVKETENKEQEEENNYISRKAEEALKSLRAL